MLEKEIITHLVRRGHEMRFLRVVMLACLLASVPGAATPVRVAVLDLLGDERGEVTSRLRELARDDGRLSAEVLDRDLARLAARGAGYQGSLNLSLGEARALGQSLGCDFFVLGKVLETRRQTGPQSHYFESQAGLFLVESRGGRMLRFLNPRSEASDAARAHAGLLDDLPSVWAVFSRVMSEADRSVDSPEPSPEAMPIEIYSELEPAAADGVTPPAFFRQLKPAYPEAAARAEIAAIVELTAVFQADGQVGEVEVQRWAGYGLDESAVETLRRLSFRPATRQGKPVSFRGLVRYNFRRPSSQAIRSSAQSQEEIDRLKKSLRDILKSKPAPD